MGINNASTFGDLLSFYRRRAGLSQEELGARTGYSKSYISKLEISKRAPSLAVVNQIARNLPLDEQEKRLLLEHAMKHIVPQEQLREDWGEAPSPRELYGRTCEVQMLQQWIVTEQKRVVAILGLGGIGKTILAAQIAKQVKDHFEYIFWRSLYNAPPVQSILQAFLVFSDQRQAVLPQEVDQQMVALLNFLRDHRCLLVLDNVDAVMEDGHIYPEGYESYGTLIRRVGEAQHQSCLLLTSRIKPPEMAFLSGGQRSHAETLHVRGLDSRSGQKLLEEKGISGDNEEYASLVRIYAGNPFAMQIIADSIREMFGGDLHVFLQHIEDEKEETTAFGDISLLLHQQLLPLTEKERNILYWLAIEREAITLDSLRKNMTSITKGSLLDAVDSLLRRSLIEPGENGLFGLQPVILEYLTNDFVTCVYREIEQASPHLLASHALIKAQTKDYIHESQRRLILLPLAHRLSLQLGKVAVEARCQAMLAALRQSSPQANYLAGNLLNLLIYLHADHRRYDFSHLTVWQADLRNVSLPAMNFAHANLKDSVFCYPFDAIIAMALHSGKFATASTTNQVLVWSAEGIPLFTCSHQDWVWRVAFSPDGSQLASGCDDHQIRL